MKNKIHSLIVRRNLYFAGAALCCSRILLSSYAKSFNKSMERSLRTCSRP